MSESMIERVARAMAKVDGLAEIPAGKTASAWHDLARAAIEEMREPTDAMQKAIRPQSYTIEHYHGSGHHRTFPTLGSGPIGAWQDMIDAALNEHANAR